ncbi:MAG: hypothetical protein JWO67_3334 [Streptosporangiaceae bacterium]|nr:hypothetical protein [Streptosporangiaceae bacterium]
MNEIDMDEVYASDVDWKATAENMQQEINRLRALVPDPTLPPQAALIEIVELDGPEFNPSQPGTGYVKPNQVRINGVPLAIPRDEAIEVHRVLINHGGEYPVGEDVLQVTLTLFARRVVMGPDQAAQG